MIQCICIYNENEWYDQTIVKVTYTELSAASRPMTQNPEIMAWVKRLPSFPCGECAIKKNAYQVKIKWRNTHIPCDISLLSKESIKFSQG